MGSRERCNLSNGVWVKTQTDMFLVYFERENSIDSNFCMDFCIYRKFHISIHHNILFVEAYILNLYNQTVNDGVAHSKNPKKCAYHVTFDLDLEYTLDAR